MHLKLLIYVIIVISLIPFIISKNKQTNKTNKQTKTKQKSAACICEQINLAFWIHVGARIFKGQRSSTDHKMLLFVSWRNQYAIIKWPLSNDAPSSTHGVFTSSSLSSTVAYISVELSLVSCWRRDIFRVKGQGLITNYNFL